MTEYILQKEGQHQFCKVKANLQAGGCFFSAVNKTAGGVYTTFGNGGRAVKKLMTVDSNNIAVQKVHSER